ncbi:MAG: phage terminase large subunit [Bacteroidales bacterium]|jgi:phage terminase large subunit
MRKINKNFATLVKALNSGRRGLVMEGGSRSGKTWSGIDFMSYVAHRYPGCSICLVKETYNSFKTTLYDDFAKRLPMRNPFGYAKEIRSFWIAGSKVSLIGADEVSKFYGLGTDFFWINEALTVSKQIFDQLEMRCKRFWWMDFNPSLTEHWIFNVLERRPDVRFIRTTMLDNPYISKWERAKILSYDPANPVNVERGTADEFMHAVYALGERRAPQGVIFNNVEWIDKFPDDIELVTFGMDFGHTNSPTALGRVGKDGANLYLESLFYAPCDDITTLQGVCFGHIGDGHVWCDSAEPGMIAALAHRGVKAIPVTKFAGSVRYGIDLLKSYKIHVVRSPEARREVINYKWREVHGIQLNDPIDEFNHLWDAWRYAVMMQFPS